MSRWHEEFDSHQVHSRITNIRNILADEALKKLDLGAEQEISRFSKVMDLLETVLKNADHEIISKGQLDQLNNQLSSAEGQLTTFKSNSNQQHLKNANDQLDAVLNHLATISAIASPNTFAGDISLNAMIKRGEDYLVTLDTRRKELQQQIAGLKTSSSHLETKVTDLQTQVDQKIKELNQLSSNWTKQFNDSQTDKEARFKASITTIEQTATLNTDQIVEKLNLAVSEKRSGYEEKVDYLLEDAETRHAEIKKLHGLVANDSITGGYKKTADDEAKSANFWRGGSIFFALLAVFWLGYIFWQAGGINWKTSLSGLPITFILLSLAGYVGHQSSLHRQQANRQRQFALEMVAIDPYLENLGEDERRIIKAELSKKYFGQMSESQEKHSSKDSVILPGSLVERLIKIIPKGGD